MTFVQVIGMFDDPAALERAESALIEARLATGATIRVEPEELVEDLHPPRPDRGLWERLRDLLPGESDETSGQYAQGVRRGSWLLVARVPEE